MARPMTPGSKTQQTMTKRRLLAMSLLACGALALPGVAEAQQTVKRLGPSAQTRSQMGESEGRSFKAHELVDSGHKFFGNVSRGLALTVEEAVRRWGEPNGYILGQEAAGAVVGGLRFGEGVLYTRNAGDKKVFWQGPSLGWDFGGEGARTMMLVYKLNRTSDMFHRFGGIDGSAYFIGGFGMTALTGGDGIIIVPIRSGVGARLGVNIGYLKFTDSPTWNPF